MLTKPVVNVPENVIPAKTCEMLGSTSFMAFVMAFSLSVTSEHLSVLEFMPHTQETFACGCLSIFFRGEETWQECMVFPESVCVRRLVVKHRSLRVERWCHMTGSLCRGRDLSASSSISWRPKMQTRLE